MCELCEARRTTPMIYEDTMCWVAKHKGSKVIVLKRHTDQPTREERSHLRRVARMFFPAFMGPQLIPQHYYLQEV